MNNYKSEIWIPSEIWEDPNLIPLEKVFLAQVHYLFDFEKKGCIADNDYFMKFLNIKKARLRDLILDMKDEGWMEQKGRDGTNRILKVNLKREKSE